MMGTNHAAATNSMEHLISIGSKWNSGYLAGCMSCIICLCRLLALQPSSETKRKTWETKQNAWCSYFLVLISPQRVVLLSRDQFFPKGCLMRHLSTIMARSESWRFIVWPEWTRTSTSCASMRMNHASTVSMPRSESSMTIGVGDHKRPCWWETSLLVVFEMCWFDIWSHREGRTRR